MSDPQAEVAALLAEVYQAFLSIQQTNWTQVSALVVVLYDYVLTFDREIKLMWTRGWSSGKILFFVIRYLTVAMMLFATLYMFRTTYTVEGCLIWARLQWIGGLLIAILTEVVLQLRIYALYMRSKRILALLIVSFTLTIAATCVIIAKILQLESVVLQPIPLFSYETCLDIILPSFFPAFWIPILACEVMLVSLALAKGVQMLRVYRSGATPGHMTMYLLRDSMLYFTVVFAIYFVNEVVWWTGGVRLMEIPVGFAMALGSIMSQRLLLNIRENWAHTPQGSEFHSIEHAGSSGVGDDSRDRDAGGIPLSTFNVSLKGRM